MSHFVKMLYWKEQKHLKVLNIKAMYLLNNNEKKYFRCFYFIQYFFFEWLAEKIISFESLKLNEDVDFWKGLCFINWTSLKNDSFFTACQLVLGYFMPRV